MAQVCEHTEKTSLPVRVMNSLTWSLARHAQSNCDRDAPFIKGSCSFHSYSFTFRGKCFFFFSFPAECGYTLRDPAQWENVNLKTKSAGTAITSRNGQPLVRGSDIPWRHGALSCRWCILTPSGWRTGLCASAPQPTGVAGLRDGIKVSIA